MKFAEERPSVRRRRVTLSSRSRAENLRRSRLARRRLLLEAMEERSLLATIDLMVNLYQDNGGVPGALINTNSVTAGQDFFVEITAKDTSAAPSGIIGLALDIGFSAANFDEIDSPFNPADPASPIITADFPLSRGGTLDNATGTIDELSGVSLPNLNIGEAIGVATHERFALLKFKAEAVVTNSPFTITIGSGSVAFADGSSLTAGSTIEAQTITVEPNNGPVPTLTIDDISANEGSGGGTTDFTFTVSLTPASALPVLVQVDTANGTAIAPGDYGAVVGTVLTFAPGETTKTVTVKVVADNILEPVETFTVNLSKADGAVIGDSQGLGTILDDDAVTASITKTVTQAEGNAGTTNFDFTVTLDQTAATDVVIPWAFDHGNTIDADFAAGLTKSGKVTIPAGQLSAKIAPTFPVNGDNTVELDETFTVTLSTPETAGVALSADKVGTGTITNDDSATIVITGPVAAAEGNAGNIAREFTVTLSNPVDVPVSINFQTQDGTATTAGNDYVPVNGQLTFNAGSTAAQKISVDVVGDTAAEPDEQFSVLLDSLVAGVPARNVAIQTNTATATILNDDSATITIQSVSIVEGNAGTQNLKFSVKLSNPVAGEVSVDLATQDGTATAGVDYTATNNTISFPANSTEAIDFLVPITGDNVVELDETFSILFSNLQSGGFNVTLPAGPIMGTITNDDAATITLNSQSQLEGNAGTQNMVFTATLSNPVDVDVTVDFATSDGTATTGDNDYTATTQKLTFTKGGPLTQTINVPIIGDTTVETDEAFNVAVSNLQADGRSVTLGEAQTGTILDDDDSTPVASINDVALAEGNAGNTAFVFTITLSKANPIADVIIEVSTANVTALAGTDYTAITKQAVTIPQGQTSATVTVQVTGETLIENDETFTLSITKIDGAKLGDAEGLGTIVNDDFTNVSIDSVTLAEGNAGTTNFDFTVTLDTAAEFDTVIPWSFSHVDTNDADFTAGLAQTGKVTVTKGSKTATISFPVSGDTKLETNEKFNVTLGTPENAAIKLSANVVGVGTITNDDQVIVSIDDLTQNEPPFGSTTNYDFTVSLDQAAEVDVVVPWTFAHVTTADADFNSTPTASGKVTIAKGSTSAKVTPSFVVAPDLLTEGNETFTVTLGTPETDGAVLTQTAADQVGTGTVVDARNATASIDSATLNEGNAGTTSFDFTVTLDQVTLVDVIIPWTLANVTSKDSDFAAGQAKTGKVTIVANTKSATIPIGVNGDTTLEANNTFTVTLGTPESANAVLDGAKSTGTGTITNDDQATVVINNVTDTEPANGATKDFIFTATIDSLAEIDVVVPWSFAHVTTSDPDFGAGLTKSGKLTIPAGSLSAPLTPAFPVAGDLLTENQETFTVTLQTPETTGAVLGAEKVGTGTINDVTTVTASIGNKTLAEGDAGSTTFEFTVTLDATSNVDVVIPWTLANGTSTDADFAAGQSKTGKVTVPAGQTTATVPISVNGDTALEGDDTFTVTLGTPETANVALNDNSKVGAGTISNDDQVTVTVDGQSQNEGNAGTTNYEFTVTIDQAADIDVVVPWTFAHVTTNKDDFGGIEPLTTGKVTILAGQTSAKIPSFAVSGDTVLEADETFTVTLGSPETAGAVLGANKTATSTLVNDDTVNVTIGTFSKLEGNVGTTAFDFTVTLDQAASIDVVVPWVFANVSTTDDDFAASLTKSGKVTIPAGQTTAAIPFSINGDTTIENDETFTVTLQTPETNGAVLGAAKVGTATVQNDDSATATINDVTLAEGNAGTTTFNFIVTLDKASPTDVVIPFTLANGTSTDADFAAGQAKTGKVTILAGQTTGTIPISVNGDTTLEGNDTFTVTLGTPETDNAALGVAKVGTGTITNDDQVTVTITEKVSQTEGNAGTKDFDFTVTLDKLAEVDVVVPYTFAHVTTSDADFSGGLTKTGKVTIPAGQLSAKIAPTFAVNGDTTVEANETFTVTLTTPDTSGAVLGTTKVGTGTIENDDSVVVSIGAVTKSEGNAGTTAFDFEVSLDQAVGVDVVVPWTFAHVTTADNDFAAGLTKSGKVTIPAGQTKATIPFSVNGDTLVETDESFTVSLGTPETNGATLSTTAKIGTGIVQNDDTATASIQGVTQNEGNSGTTNFDFTVTLDKAAAFDVTIPWTFAHGTTADSDFTGGFTKAGSVVVPAGQLTAKITPNFPVIGDTTVEANETFTVTLGTPDKTSVSLSANDKVGTSTITNDDSAVINIANAKQFEPATGTSKITFDVMLTQPVDVDTTVTYTLTHVTTSDADFSNLTKTSTLTFLAGSKTPVTPLSFDIASDAVSEPDETFTVTLSNPTLAGGVTRNVTVGPAATGTIQQDPATGKLSGFAYVDANNNGVKDANEAGIPGVTITLTGTPTSGSAITLTAMTADDGSYAFTNLGGGKYEITQTQPATMFDGIDTVGTQGGTLANDKISAITLDPAEEGTGNNFGELGLLPQFVTKRLFLASTPPPAQTLRVLNGRAAELAGNQTLADQIFGATVPSVVAAPALNTAAANNTAAAEFVPESAGEFIPEDSPAIAQSQIAPPSPAPTMPVSTPANGSMYSSEAAATTAKSTVVKTTTTKTTLPKATSTKPVEQTTSRAPATPTASLSKRTAVRSLSSAAAASSTAASASGPSASDLQLLALDDVLAREKKWR